MSSPRIFCETSRDLWNTSYVKGIPSDEILENFTEVCQSENNWIRLDVAILKVGNPNIAIP